MTRARTLANGAALVLTFAAADLAVPLAAQVPAESREVRQLVTFRFLPGQTGAALDLYRTFLVPIYREIEPMRMVRLLSEVESPEPLDLMVVTHYADMAAMDRANRLLRQLPPDRPPIGDLYRQISDISLGHHDQFVEVLSPSAVAPTPDGMLEVLEFLRVTPGSGGEFERQVLAAVQPWEQEPPVRNLILRSETARFLIADGWDYLRTYAVRDLAAWQAYSAARGRHPPSFVANRLVEARKTLVLREIADLRVR
jgi:hypothetical protein